MLVKPQMVSRLQNLNDHESQCEPEDNEVIHTFTLQISALCFPGLVVICQRDLNSSSKPYKSSNERHVSMRVLFVTQFYSSNTSSTLPN